MKKYISIFFVALTLSAGLSSCEDMLTEKPDSAYDLDQYFTSESKAEMSVMGIYSSITHPNLYGSRIMATFVSDDTHFTSRVNSDGAIHDMSNYTLAATNKWISDLWKYTYEAIDRCNFSIAGISGMKGYEENKTLQKLVAEARFLRAFMAFDLVRFWETFLSRPPILRAMNQPSTRAPTARPSTTKSLKTSILPRVTSTGKTVRKVPNAPARVLPAPC